MGSLSLAALKVEEESELIVGCFLEAIKKGDWRAAESLMHRVYGRPKEKLEVAQPQTVEEVETLSLSQIRALRGRLELVRDDTQPS